MDKIYRFIIIIVGFLFVFSPLHICAKEYTFKNILTIDIPDKWITITWPINEKILKEIYEIIDQVNKDSNSSLNEKFLVDFVQDGSFLLKSMSVPFSGLIIIQKLPKSYNDFYIEVINKFDIHSKEIDKEVLSLLNETNNSSIKIIKYEPCRLVSIDGIIGISFSMLMENNGKRNITINYILPLKDIPIQIQFISNSVENIIKLNVIKNSIKFANKEEQKYNIDKEYKDILEDLENMRN